jgi:hypothetical protein
MFLEPLIEIHTYISLVLYKLDLVCYVTQLEHCVFIWVFLHLAKASIIIKTLLGALFKSVDFPAALIAFDLDSHLIKRNSN